MAGYGQGGYAEVQTEEQRLWGVVTANPLDFTSWTYLLAQVEQEPVDLSRVRNAYEAFLKEYPLCFGYWKKYADLEGRSGRQKASEIYERSVQSVPHSVDAWVNYVNFLEDGLDLALTRQVYERGLAYVGIDLHDGHQLWEKYIGFEASQSEFAAVTKLYGRVLEVPLLNIEKLWEKFRNFIHTRTSAEVMTKEEAANIDAVRVTPDMGPEQIDAAKRERLISKHESTFRAAAIASGQRKNFENNIRRPYFHIKSLEEAQLDNWRQYLNFEEKEGNAMRTVKLYERCVVATALYSEFWERYATYLGNRGLVADARAVFGRAANHFLKHKPNIHLSFALFEEIHGAVDHAREIYTRVLAIVPNMVTAIVDAANMERRRGELPAAAARYETALGNLEGEAYSFLAMQAANFFQRTMNKQDKAREILMTAIGKRESDLNLWLYLLDFEINCNETHRAQALFNLAMGADSKFSADEQLIFLRRNIDFLNDHGSDPRMLAALRTKLSSKLSSSDASGSRKRPAEDDGARAAKRPTDYYEQQGAGAGAGAYGQQAYGQQAGGYGQQQQYGYGY